MAHYHEERPHQGLGNEVVLKERRVAGKARTDVLTLRQIHCKQRLGGLLKSYSRKAA
jgi:putative transposase